MLALLRRLSGWLALDLTWLDREPRDPTDLELDDEAA